MRRQQYYIIIPAIVTNCKPPNVLRRADSIVKRGTCLPLHNGEEVYSAEVELLHKRCVNFDEAGFVNVLLMYGVLSWWFSFVDGDLLAIATDFL